MKIEKKLDEEQAKSVSAVLRKKGIFPSVLAKTMMEVFELIAEEENDVWDSLHKLTETTRETHELQYSHINRTVIATPIEESEED